MKHDLCRQSKVTRSQNYGCISENHLNEFRVGSNFKQMNCLFYDVNKKKLYQMLVHGKVEVTIAGGVRQSFWPSGCIPRHLIIDMF